MPPTASRRDEALTPETSALITKYYSLTMKIAWDYYRSLPPGTHHIDELLSAATWALVDAALRWRPYCEEHGYEPVQENKSIDYFNTFCQRSVKGALYDFSRSEDYVSREIRDIFREATSLFAAGRDREAVASVLNISEQKLSRAIASVAAHPLSIFADEAQNHYNATVDNVEQLAGYSYLLSMFGDIIDSMPKRNRLVLALRYYVGMDIEEIAKLLNLPVSQAQKTHTESIIEIRSRMESIAAASA